MVWDRLASHMDRIEDAEDVETCIDVLSGPMTGKVCDHALPRCESGRESLPIPSQGLQTS